MVGIATSTGVQASSGEDFYDNVLNNMYLPAVADTVINPNELLRLLPRDKTRVQGKNIVYPVHIGRNLGGNAIAENGNLPDPFDQQYSQYAFPVKHLYQRILFSGISMDASRSDVASWLRVVESEVTGAARDMARRRNRIFNNDGSGRLAQVSATPTTVSVTLKINDGIEQASGVTTASFPPTTFIAAGMRLAVLTNSGGSAVAVTVSSVTNNTVIVVSDHSGMVADDWIVEISRTGTVATADSGYQNEPMGIAGIFSDADPIDGTTGGFQGVDSDAAANDWHRATIVNNSGTLRSLTERLMQQAFSDAIRIGEANVDCIFGSFGMINTYIDLLLGGGGTGSGARRFVSDANEGTGGLGTVNFNGIPMIADRDCYASRFYFIDKSNLRVYVMADPQWMNFDGSVYHRLADKDAYQATLYCRETLGVDVRDKCVLLTDITEI